MKNPAISALALALGLATAWPTAARGEEWDVVADDDDDAATGDESAAAAPEPDDEDLSLKLHGAFENQLTAMWPRQYNGEERLYVYDYTRLRVDLDADLPAGIQVRSDAVARIFVGETEYWVVNLIPKRTFDRLVARDPRWSAAIGDRYSLENELYLDNAYAKIPVLKAVLSVGKQPLAQGAGYVWNPTNVFTVKEMFDPTYEREGIVSARLVVPIAEIASIDLAAAPDGKFERWTYGGRASLRLGPVSLSATSYSTRVKRTDTEGSMDGMVAAAAAGGDPEDAILAVDAQRTMVGGDVIADVAGVRLWAEGAYNFVDDEDGAQGDWWELVGGAEYYFPFETHVMVEYYHYGAGPLQVDGSYSFNAWMRVLATELNMLGRDFVFEAVDHPVADFWTVGLSSFQSISDGSAAIMADVRWAFTQDAELWLLLSGAVGDPDDFMSSAKGQGWLRLTVHF